MVAAFPHTASASESTTAPTHPLRFLACTLALAGSFVATVSPPGVSTVALNVRFLLK